jgi:peptidoglycan/LPS O-acetylase OafA/YrhL
MRALAALVVLFNHGYAQSWSEAGDPTGPLSIFKYFMVLGHLAVSVFIVISGFCLMLPVVRAGGELRGGARLFFKRRARRILPPYYSALALSLLLIWTVIGNPTGTLWDVAIQIRKQDIAAHVLMLHDVFGTGRINYAFWSIATEWQIYLFFPLLVWMWLRWGPAVTVSSALAVGYAVATAAADTRLYRAHVQFLGLFTLGMLAASITHGEDLPRLRVRLPWAILAVACAALTASLTLHWGWKAARGHFVALDGLVGIVALSLLVLSSRSEDSAVRRFFSWTPLAVIGGFSYSLYLIHAPLLQLFWQFFLRPLGVGFEARFVLIVLLGMPSIVGAAWLFYRVFEKPFIAAPSPAPAEVEARLAASPSP